MAENWLELVVKWPLLSIANFGHATPSSNLGSSEVMSTQCVMRMNQNLHDFFLKFTVHLNYLSKPICNPHYCLPLQILKTSQLSRVLTYIPDYMPKYFNVVLLGSNYQIMFLIFPDKIKQRQIKLNKE